MRFLPETGFHCLDFFTGPEFSLSPSSFSFSLLLFSSESSSSESKLAGSFSSTSSLTGFSALEIGVVDLVLDPGLRVRLVARLILGVSFSSVFSFDSLTGLTEGFLNETSRSSLESASFLSSENLEKNS